MCSAYRSQKRGRRDEHQTSSPCLSRRRHHDRERRLGNADHADGQLIETAVSDYGTLGSDGSTSPGLIHDPTGTGNFDPSNDYITPGYPHQGFSTVADNLAFNQNDNAGISDFGTTSPTLLTGAAAMGYTNAASWTGSNNYLQITNSYFFNPGDERVLVSTTLTALQDLTGLAFATSVDPDPDELRYGTFDTVNQRGNSLYGIDDFIGSAGSTSGLTLALLNVNDGGYAHSTSINFDCCSNINPRDVLGHTGGDAGTSGTGDHGLNLAYNIGSLAEGASATVTYAYAVGDALETTGGTSPVAAAPEPGTWAMMLAGFGLAGFALRRGYRRSEERFTAKVRGAYA